MSKQPAKAGPQEPVGLMAAELSYLAKWLGSKRIAVRMSMVSEGLQLSAAAEGHSSERLSIEVTQGQLVLETGLQDIERLLMLVGQEAAAEHGVQLQNMSIKLVSHHPRQLDWYLFATAKRGRLGVSVDVEFKGRLKISDRFEAELIGLDIRGKGILGGVVAALLRPRLKEINGRKFAIADFVPGNLQLDDVRMVVDEQVRLIARLEPSSLVLDTPIASSRQAPTPKNNRGQKVQTREGKKLDIYIIDTGQNVKSKTILNSHLVLFESFLIGQNVYSLSQSQSVEVLAEHPILSGADPIIVVVDSELRMQKPEKGIGFRLCLGALPEDEDCAKTLKRMLQIMAEEVLTDDERSGSKVDRKLVPAAMDSAMQIIIDVVEPTATH